MQVWVAGGGGPPAANARKGGYVLKNVLSGFASASPHNNILV